MSGDFKTDITRDTFRKQKHYSRVLMQQGRVQLDADWNEQTDILLHYLRTLVSDLIGPHAGPLAVDGKEVSGFKILPHPSQATSGTEKPGAHKKPTEAADMKYRVQVQEGHYYVDGILVENDAESFIFGVEEEEQKEGSFLFYLDVWEHEVNYQEDNFIRESALGGPDTATRAQVVWQVRARAIKETEIEPPSKDIVENKDNWGIYVGELTDKLREQAPYFTQSPMSRGYLKARTLEIDQAAPAEPCTVPPTSTYRGAENQLYRVEIHTSGPAYKQPMIVSARGRQEGDDDKDERGKQEQATFKWSRENASIVFPIAGPVSEGNTLTLKLEELGRDDTRYTLHVDDWVEIVDQEDTLERELYQEAGQLFQVIAVDYTTMQVSLQAYGDYQPVFDTDSDLPRLLRRWDYQELDSGTKGATTLAANGAIQLIENKWLTLEDGIQVLFHHDLDKKPDQDQDDLPPYYRSGDYWLIPARTSIGGIEWPQHKHEHAALPPHGVDHHYAPLAFVEFDSNGAITANGITDLRRQINPAWSQIFPQGQRQ